jgi:acid phosphatase (class A)
MKDARLLLGMLGLAVFLTLALAKETVANPHWLSQQEIEAIVASEPAPPAAGSDAEKADMQEEIDAQTTRTPERIAEAKLDANYSVTLFTNLIGPKIASANDPVMFHFFNQVNAQIGEVAHDSKAKWKRPRPYVTHPDVIHPIFTASDYSYPSGHATHAFAFAEVLAAMFPDRATAFLDRAQAIAQSRVDAGVHYTTDIREGEVVGKEIAKELLAKPEFQRAMNAAALEVAAQSNAPSS